MCIVEKENNIIKIYDITSDLKEIGINDLNDGIWNVLNKYKSNELNLTFYDYKDYYTIMQLLDIFKNINYFCIQYNEGCKFKLY